MRAALDVVPGELAGPLDLEMRAQRMRIVVADQFQALADVELTEGREDQRMTLARRQHAEVELDGGDGLFHGDSVEAVSASKRCIENASIVVIGI